MENISTLSRLLSYENTIKQDFDPDFELIETILFTNPEKIEKLDVSQVDEEKLLYFEKNTFFTKKRRNHQKTLKMFEEVLSRENIIGIGKRPDPEITEKLRDQIYTKYKQPLLLSNIRVICEALRHPTNASIIIQEMGKSFFR